ncbi:MAG: hypothetical protein ACRDT8_00090 [Micromonosporaceae bacterium]
MSAVEYEQLELPFDPPIRCGSTFGVLRCERDRGHDGDHGAKALVIREVIEWEDWAANWSNDMQETT